MIDPITAMATASAAFNALKKGVEVGRDIESMAGDIGRWMSCLSDVEQAEKEARNPPLFKKVFNKKSVEEEALELFMTKKKIKDQRDQLRDIISWQLGPQAWSDLIQSEIKIRKERQETLYKQRNKRKAFIEAILIGVVFIAGCGILWAFIAFLIAAKNGTL